MAGLYLHIPFCRHACSYCSFYFSTQQSLIDAFVEALINEIKSTSTDTLFELGMLKTLYFGGGTPSLLPIDAVEKIFSTLKTVFDMSNIEEITFEINPENADIDYLTAIKNIGVNRLSMGVQSFHPHILRSMHRSHTKEQAQTAIETIKKAGFNSYNIDLIYAYPAESIEELKSDLASFIALDLPHISAYSLTVEPGTRLKQQIDKEKIKELDEDLQAEHFDLVSKTLANAGFSQYETSNFAKPNQESKHNSNYWSHKNYLGFGPASHSFLWSNNSSIANRWASPSDLTSYINNNGCLAKEELKELPLEELAEERLMLALRTKKGLNLTEWEQLYQTSLTKAQNDLLEQWVEIGFINAKAWENNTLILTEKTFAIADHIVYRLVTAS